MPKFYILFQKMNEKLKLEIVYSSPSNNIYLSIFYFTIILKFIVIPIGVINSV